MRTMFLSHRSGLDREPNALSKAIAALRAEGQGFVDLTVSNPTCAGLAYDETGILRALSEPRSLRYSPEPLGAFSARQAVADLWAELGFAVSPERVLITASTSEAYAHLFKLLCDPGDQVLVPAPSYPLFEHLARFEGVRPVAYPLHFDGAWYVDLERVRALAGPRVRAIVVVSPNNPTGSFLKQNELEALSHLGLPLISDEVFGTYPVQAPPNAARSALCSTQGLVFVLSGLSKVAALPQMKLGWITLHGPTPLVEEAMARLEVLADAYLSPSAPVMLALPELLHSRRTSEAQIRTRISVNARSMARSLSGTPATALPVEGGWSQVVRLPKIQSEDAYVLGLLSEVRVLVQPGYFYDFSEEPYAVVSLLTPEPDFDEGTRRMIAYLARHAS